MSGRIRYIEEFKREAAAQVVNQGHSTRAMGLWVHGCRHRLHSTLY